MRPRPISRETIHDIEGARVVGANPAPILTSAPPLAKNLAALQWLERLVGAEDLAWVRVAAARNGVEPHAELLAHGFIDQRSYATALGRELDQPVRRDIPLEAAARPVELRGGPRMLRWAMDGTSRCIIEATREPPDIVAAHVAALERQGLSCSLAAQADIDLAIEDAGSQARADAAVNGLLRTAPECSAASGWPLAQLLAPGVLAGLVVGGLCVLPDATLAFVTGLMALPFLCVTALRLLAVAEVLIPDRTAAPRATLPRAALPSYSILVPLFREQEVLPELVRALSALDYPAAKLEVLLLIESVDLETQATLLGLPLPAHFRVVIVPDCQPRTKPKALNYALALATGDLVVVYDAEDRPQPSQLRHAAEVFARAPRDVGCVQARLNIYNSGQSWFTRQFTIEYTALFDATLPVLERLNLPVPLGGTSNHFRRSTLIRLGGWDPFNVTEDADLGIRLARRGYRTQVIASTTWEEAPVTFGVWIRQRTRWIKGWMQTWAVHMRDLGALGRDLGMIGALGVNAVLGGLVVSALVQPLFYLLVAVQAAKGELFTPAEGLLSGVLMAIAWGNLLAGYVVSILVGGLSVWRRGRRRLALDALMMPAYWMLVSLAAYRALYQLVREPYRWEKTPHGRAARRRGRRRV